MLSFPSSEVGKRRLVQVQCLTQGGQAERKLPARLTQCCLHSRRPWLLSGSPPAKVDTCSCPPRHPLGPGWWWQWQTSGRFQTAFSEDLGATSQKYRGRGQVRIAMTMSAARSQRYLRAAFLPASRSASVHTLRELEHHPGSGGGGEPPCVSCWEAGWAELPERERASSRHLSAPASGGVC